MLVLWVIGVLLIFILIVIVKIALDFKELIRGMLRTFGKKEM